MVAGASGSALASGVSPILVCSKGRPDGSTFGLLAASGLKAHVIVEPQDVESYRGCDVHGGNEVIELKANDQGISYARNAALDYGRKAGWRTLWLLDDDLKRFHRADFSSHRLQDATAHAALAGAERIIEAAGVDQGALEYAQFAWSARPRAAWNSYCDVVVWFDLARLGALRYRGEKEDRDMTLQILTSGGRTVRVPHFSFSCPRNGSNAGGLKSRYDDPSWERAAVQALVLRWPGVCTAHVKPSGRIDAKINWSLFSPRRLMRQAPATAPPTHGREAP